MVKILIISHNSNNYIQYRYWLKFSYWCVPIAGSMILILTEQSVPTWTQFSWIRPHQVAKICPHTESKCHRASATVAHLGSSFIFIYYRKTHIKFFRFDLRTKWRSKKNKKLKCWTSQQSIAGVDCLINCPPVIDSFMLGFLGHPLPALWYTDMQHYSSAQRNTGEPRCDLTLLAGGNTFLRPVLICTVSQGN